MDQKEIMKIVGMFEQILPKFPDGRIDYTESDAAAVILVFVKCKDEILLLKRSEKVSTHRGVWDVVAGYLDEIKPVKQKVLEELKEESGIDENDILSIHIREGFKSVEKIKKWFVLPVLVELKSKPDIKLDWEHTEYKWIKPEELEDLETVPNLAERWKNLHV